MKIIKVFCLLSVLLMGCSHANKPHKSQKNSTQNEMKSDMSSITKVEMRSLSRGAQIAVEVTPELFKFAQTGTNPRSFEKEMSSAQWDEFTSLFSDQLLSDLPQLEITDKSFMRDASMATTLTVFEGDKEIQSPVYAHNNPPIELKNVMDFINYMSK